MAKTTLKPRKKKVAIEYDSSTDVEYYVNESLNPFYVPETCTHSNLKGLGGRLNAYGWYVIRTSVSQGKVWPYWVEERAIDTKGNYGTLIAAKHIKSDSRWYFAGTVDALTRRNRDEQRQADAVHIVLNEFDSPHKKQDQGSAAAHPFMKESLYPHTKHVPTDWLLREIAKEREWKRTRSIVRAVYIVLQAKVKIPGMDDLCKSVWWDVAGISQANDYYEVMDRRMKGEVKGATYVGLDQHVRDFMHIYARLGNSPNQIKLSPDPAFHAFRLIKRKTTEGVKVYNKV